MSEETQVNGQPQGSEEPPDDVLRLGGMALRNGLLIHGPTSWSVAARGADGEVHVASGPKPVIAPELAAKVPILRGPLRLIEAFAVIPLVRTRLPEARLPFEAPRVIAATLISGVLGRILREKAEPTREARGLGSADRDRAGGHRAQRSQPCLVPRGRAHGDRRLRKGIAQPP